MKPFPLALAIAACALLVAGSAGADPELNGVAVNSTVANGNTNAAVGAFSTTRQAIGVVNGWGHGRLGR